MIHKMSSFIIYDNGRPTVKVTAFPGRERVWALCYTVQHYTQS